MQNVTGAAGLRKAPISEKMRPCVHWSPDQGPFGRPSVLLHDPLSGIDHFIYDLLCMKYHEQDDEFHFW
eukprot:748443-Hanusia_phi.AAC.2